MASRGLVRDPLYHLDVQTCPRASGSPRAVRLHPVVPPTRLGFLVNGAADGVGQALAQQEGRLRLGRAGGNHSGPRVVP